MSGALGHAQVWPSRGALDATGEPGRRAPPGRHAWGVLLLAGVTVGVVDAVGWLPAAAFLTAIALCAAGLLNRRAFVRIFLVAVAILLLGYASLGRGFAYVGLAPLYVGDIVFAIGLIAGLVGGLAGVISRSMLWWLLLAYIAWGALRTVPYIEEFGVDTLRDAVVWAYAGYGILVAACLLKTGWWRSVPSIYGRCLPWLLSWLPIAFLLNQSAQLWLPRVPGTSVPIIFLKPGDISVHLAGAASFLLLCPDGGRAAKPRLLEWTCWALWSCLFLAMASVNRGGMLAILAALSVTFLFRRSRRWLLPGVVAASLAALLIVSDFELRLRAARAISPRQVLENALSIFGASESRDLSGTRNWRLEWWTEIVSYTILGEHFWAGKGFGVNLASDDGFQVGDGRTLRSPHNGHLTILARTGVPGFGLWIALQGLLAVTLARTAIRAKRQSDLRWSAFNVWLLAYWSAFMVNTGFDVYLEGPQGGIWFWCLVGLGITSSEVERRRSDAVSSIRFRRPAMHEITRHA